MHPEQELCSYRRDPTLDVRKGWTGGCGGVEGVGRGVRPQEEGGEIWEVGGGGVPRVGTSMEKDEEGVVPTDDDALMRQRQRE